MIFLSAEVPRHAIDLPTDTVQGLARRVALQSNFAHALREYIEKRRSLIVQLAEKRSCEHFSAESLKLRLQDFYKTDVRINWHSSERHENRIFVVRRRLGRLRQTSLTASPAPYEKDHR
jgi:hypothetical protein